MSTEPKLAERLHKLVRWNTIQQGLFLFVAVSGSSFFNFLYHFIIGRWLGPGHYATLAALIGLLTSVSAPVGLSQLVMTDMTARLLALNQPAQVKMLLRHMASGLTLIASVIVIVLVFGSEAIGHWLNLTSASNVIVLALALGPALVLPAFLGCLQGGQDFRGLSLVLLITGITRLAVGIALVWLGLTVNGAMGGFAISGLIAIGLAAWLLDRHLNIKAESLTVNVRNFIGFSLQATIASAAFAILTSTDVVFARRLFQPDLAGQYSAAATLGKIVLFLPGPVAMLMLPKSSAHHAAGAARGGILLKSALATLGLSLIVTATFFLWPREIVSLLYGVAFIEAATWVGIYGLAATGLALVNLFMIHYLAAHDRRFVLVLTLFAVIQVLLLNFLPFGPSGYIVILMCGSWGVLLISEVWLGGLRERALPVTTGN